MLRSAVVLLIISACSACSSSVQTVMVGGRDMTLEPYLAVSTPYSSGHGCAVRSDLFATARHIIQPSPLRKPSYAAWSTANNAQWGAAAYVLLDSRSQDIVLMRVRGQQLKRWYPIGNPIPHAKHYWWEYTFDKAQPENTFRRKLRGGKWLREFAGNIVLDRPATPGASGSCLFNAKGEAVGIIVKSSTMLSVTTAVRFMFTQEDIDSISRVE